MIDRFTVLGYALYTIDDQCLIKYNTINKSVEIIFCGKLDMDGFSGFSEMKTIKLVDCKNEYFNSTEGMFSRCKKLKKINLQNFDASNATDMSSMFYGCESLTSLNLRS